APGGPPRRGTYGYTPRPSPHGNPEFTGVKLFQRPGGRATGETKYEGMKMKQVVALVVAAALGRSSPLFTAETTASAAPAPSTAAPAKTVHHKKHHKAAKTAAEQKAQAAKKHHKKAAKPAVEQKAQAAKKHHKKAAKHEAAKPAAQPAA